MRPVALPFSKRTWAPQLAIVVIALTLLGEAAAIGILHQYGPLDTGEIVALFLVLLAVIPPNVHVIRSARKSTGPSLPQTILR